MENMQGKPKIQSVQKRGYSICPFSHDNTKPPDIDEVVEKMVKSMESSNQRPVKRILLMLSLAMVTISVVLIVYINSI